MTQTPAADIVDTKIIRDLAALPANQRLEEQVDEALVACATEIEALRAREAELQKDIATYAKTMDAISRLPDDTEMLTGILAKEREKSAELEQEAEAWAQKYTAECRRANALRRNLDEAVKVAEMAFAAIDDHNDHRLLPRSARIEEFYMPAPLGSKITCLSAARKLLASIRGETD